MKKKRPSIISEERLKQKHTKELLAYLKRLQQCEESFELSDMEVNLDLINVDVIYFKQTEKWRHAFKLVKAILKDREHIEK